MASDHRAISDLVGSSAEVVVFETADSESFIEQPNRLENFSFEQQAETDQSIGVVNQRNSVAR